MSDGKYAVSGLRDPLARDPLQLLGEADLTAADVVGTLGTVSGAGEAVRGGTGRTRAQAAGRRDARSAARRAVGDRPGLAGVDRGRDAAGAAHSRREPLRRDRRSFEAELHGAGADRSKVSTILFERGTTQIVRRRRRAAAGAGGRGSRSGPRCGRPWAASFESRSSDTPTATAMPRRICR